MTAFRGRQQVPVALLEYDEGGHTLWVHGPDGATVLRIKLLRGKYRTQADCINICAHADIVVPDGDVVVCMPGQKS